MGLVGLLVAVSPSLLHQSVATPLSSWAGAAGAGVWTGLGGLVFRNSCWPRSLMDLSWSLVGWTLAPSLTVGRAWHLRESALCAPLQFAH